MMRKAYETPDAIARRTDALVADMLEFHDALVQAGVMVAVEAFEHSSRAARVRSVAGRRSVIHGPFHDEHLLGFWLIEVRSLDEAMAWARRVPVVDGEVEIRQAACHVMAL